MFNSVAIDEKAGAQTILHCALDGRVDNESGRYYDNCKEKAPHPLAEDADITKNLWDSTEKLLQEYL